MWTCSDSRIPVRKSEHDAPRCPFMGPTPYPATRKIRHLPASRPVRHLARELLRHVRKNAGWKRRVEAGCRATDDFAVDRMGVAELCVFWS